MRNPPGDEAPIYRRLCELRGSLSLHTPGHKQGQRGSELLADWLPDAVTFDLTEIADLDSIHRPDGPLLQAERLTAELYGVKSTFFTTNGSTAGLIASLLSVTPPGSELLLPRNAHLSVLSAIVLGDLLPRFVQPEYRDGYVLGPRPEELQLALECHSAVRTVLLVSPSYEGVVPDLAQLIATAKAAGCSVVVDEAHGAHLPFHPALPPSGIDHGADLVVQSAHKTLSALTGGAWVHRVTDKLTDDALRSCLNLVQSTSPSWLVLGSLDLARLELARSGEHRLANVLANARLLHEEIREAGWTIWSAPLDLACRQDPLKINLQCRPKGFSGTELAAELQLRNIYPEMVHPDHVLLMLGLGDVQPKYGQLSACLRELPARDSLSSGQAPVPPPARLAIRPREAYFAKSSWTPFAVAAGRVAARPLFLYPPGVPLVYPGELLDADLITHARSILACGGDLVGMKGDLIAVVE